MMKITKVNHIGIAVSSLDEALKLYTEVLGLKLKDIEVIEEQKVKTAFQNSILNSSCQPMAFKSPEKNWQHQKKRHNHLHRRSGFPLS